MELIVFGLNHRTAPLEVRERWAFSPEESRRALEGLRASVAESEHVILSTCNRTEFYSHLPVSLSPLKTSESGAPAASGPQFIRQAASSAFEFYHQVKLLLGRKPSSEVHYHHFYVYRQEDAIEHLFRLAGGLDSMIVGEPQILGQIRDALATAQEARTVGRFFHQLFPAAIRVGKRLRSDTKIAEGCITPGQAALKIGRETLQSLAGRHILLIGSGKIASLAAKAFLEEDITCFSVVNRTPEHGRRLIEEIGGGRLLPWSQLAEAIERADLVVSSTGAPEPLLAVEAMRAIQERRGRRPLVIVDLAVPRDFDPAVGEIDGIRLFNFDSLNTVIEENISQRHAAIPLAEAMVRKEIASFQGRMFYLQVDPVLRHVVERFEQIRLGELQRIISQVPAEHHEALREFSVALVKKLLHFPIEKLKSLRDMRGLSKEEVAFLKRLFLPGP